MRARLSPANALVTFLLLLPLSAPARSVAAQGVKLAVGNVGLGIGDVPRLDGLRLNLRDRDLDLVRGLNATIWRPYDDADGVVEGLALGVPLTGASKISGVAVGAGVDVGGDFRGIALGGVGFGAGGEVRGITLGGIGVGAGGDVQGIALGGVGVGTGGALDGLAIGGVGVGAQGSIRGVIIGGVGLGAGGSLTGLGVGGVGVGANGDVRGVLIGGIGVGAGGDVTGITVGGIGVGAGGELEGLAIGGVGVGAPRIKGVVLTGFGAGGEQVRGLVIAPGFFKIEEEGRLRGVSVSAFNDIRGSQHGLSIGLLNIADELHGLQVGLINIARNKSSFGVLPIANYHR